MGLSIKNAETERRVRELARRTGLGVTSAIRLAVDNELERTPPVRKDPLATRALVREIQERWRKFPPIDMKEMDDFLYDEDGLPH